MPTIAEKLRAAKALIDTPEKMARFNANEIEILMANVFESLIKTHQDVIDMIDIAIARAEEK